MVSSAEAEVAWEAKAHLGEGSLWDRRSKKLLWLDIMSSKLFRFDPANKTNEEYDLSSASDFVSSVVPTSDEDKDPDGNKVVVTIKEGFALYNFQTKELQKLDNDPPPGKIQNERFNDGKADPAGRYWAGTITRDESGEPCVGASLFCRESDGSVKKKLEDISISNGLVWTADKSTMYYIDTPTGQVDALDYNVTTGDISNRRPCITGFDFPTTGFPDGCAIDKDGMLWVARFNGGCAGRYDPTTGKQLAEVRVPDTAGKQVTSVAFGGENHEDLYLTTAREGFGEEENKKFPLAGSLFTLPAAKMKELGAVGGPQNNHVTWPPTSASSCSIS